MSTDRSKSEDGLADIVNEAILSCQICMEMYAEEGDQTPKLLPCQHGHCIKCMKFLATQSGGTSIRCPTCREVHVIPTQAGASSLPNNLAILSLLGVVKNHKIDNERGETPRIFFSRKRKALVCSGCDRPTTELLCMGCNHCNGVWCNDCQETHSRVKIFKNHTLISYVEYVKTSEKDAEKPSGSLLLPPQCRKHPKKEIDLYCVNCSEAICSNCSVLDHSGHQTLLLKDGAKIEVAAIAKCIDHVKAGVEMIESAEMTARRDAKYFEMHLSGIKELIKTNAEEMRAAISRRETEALMIADTTTSSLQESLTTRWEALKGLLVRIRALDTTEVTTQSDLDVCISAAQLKAELQALSQKVEHLRTMTSEVARCEEVRLMLTQKSWTALNAAVAGLFEVVEEKSHRAQLPDVLTVASAVQSLKALSTELQSVNVGESHHQGDGCAVMHLLDGTFALAVSSESNQRELGAAGACSLIVTVLASAIAGRDDVTTEKCLRIIDSLCRYQDETRGPLEAHDDDTNIAELGEAGACQGEDQ